MEEHAKRLRIEWPAGIKRSIAKALATLEINDQHPTCQPMGLLRLELGRDGTIKVQPRPFSIRNESVEAITVEAPRWSPKVNGTKHGDWQPYRDAMKQADHAGTDLALLVHEYAIVDGDRATPICV
jgi:branched-subunit amino acid aminotransferase/4-amino-4-deoxychorismate lyase